MKTTLLSLVFFLVCMGITAQVPQGFNYQAIARGSDGKELNGALLRVKISILTDTLGFFASGAGTYIWEEEHFNVKTNAFGLFTVVIGDPAASKVQGSAGTFSAIAWAPVPLYIGAKVAVSPAYSYKNLGSAKLWTVPYAMYSAKTETAKSAETATNANGITSGSKLSVVSSDDATSLALFEVKRKDGQVVFAVYPDAVNVYVPPSPKGGKGGFAIGGFGTAKATSQDYFRVTPDSVRIYIPNAPAAKGGKGGFAIGGFDKAKGGLLKNYYMNVSGTSTVDTVKGSPQILWFPNKNALLAGNVHIGNADSVGIYSTALGYRSIAMGDYSQAFGYRAKAYGDYSTSIGKYSIAGARTGAGHGTSIASNSFAFGNAAKAIGDDSYALGSGAIASGFRAFAFGSVGLDDSGNPTTTPTTASQPYTFALGMGAQAIMKGALALGIGATASGYYSNSLGYYSTSSGYYSTAIGYKATASNYYTGAFGHLANASSDYAVAVGASASATNTYASSFGRAATANGANSVAVGYGATTAAAGTDASAFGKSANASGPTSMALGVSASASGNTATAIGYLAIASGQYSMALGYNSKAQALNAYSFGTDANASAENGYAIGKGATASALTSMSVGYLSSASAQNALAFGNSNISNGTYAVTLGNSNTAGTNSNSVALGNNNVSSGSYSIALGNYNTSSNSYSTAIGYYSTASGDKSLAIGAKYVKSYNPKIIIIIPRFKGGSGKGAEVDEDPNSIPAGMDNTGKGIIPIIDMNRINSADGQYSIAIGNGNASTNGGATYGVYNTASALYATAIGFQNTASATASFAAGSYNQSTGEYSTSFGRYTDAQSENSFVIGRYNIPAGTTTDWVDTDPLFQIGNGDATTAHDAFRVLKNGGTYIWGSEAYYGLYLYNTDGRYGQYISNYSPNYLGTTYGVRSYAYNGQGYTTYSGYFYGGSSNALNYRGLYADQMSGKSSDVAEYIYDSEGNTKPADVVIADPAKKESIIKSSKPYQSGVLGVISTNPQLTMGMEIVMDESTGEMKKDVKAARLALTGRVPVNVCGENGAIVPGDYLTTSSTPGFAMKWTLLDVNTAKDFDGLKKILAENEKRRNAIIGKAVDSFSGSGTGKIVVLISLQ